MAKILIADDEAVNRVLLTTLLERAGHETLEAQNGLQALLVAKAHHPDLTIIDLHMPGMHGADLVKAFRRDPQLAGMRLALYTGSAVDRMMRDFMQLTEIQYVIPKPCRPEELMRIVAEALAGC